MSNLQKNIGKVERTVRIIVGVLLLIFTTVKALTVGLTTAATISGLGGVFLLVTALVSY